MRAAAYFRAQAELCFELARYLGDKADAEEARKRGERWLLRAKDVEGEERRSKPDCGAAG